MYSCGGEKVLESVVSKDVRREDFRTLIVYPNYSMMLTPSNAVGLFTAILKREGYQVGLFDCTPYAPSHEANAQSNPEVLANQLGASRKFDAKSILGVPKTDLIGDLARRMDSFKPHAVVVSTVTEDTWPQTREILEVLAEYPETKTIVGGVFTTMAPGRVIADPLVKCIGVGEGEETVVEFCEMVRHGQPPINIPGTRAKNEEEQVVIGPVRPLFDLNSSPVPDFSLFDELRFRRPLGGEEWRSASVETYRGCPYTCAFCNSPAQRTLAGKAGQGDFLRRKSMPVLRNELTTLINRHDLNFVYINDDAFMARPPAEVEAFARMYKESIGLPFWFQTRFEDINGERLGLLKEAGAFRISFGLEHGNEEFRKKRLLRNVTNEKMVAQSEVVAEVGIPYSVNVILGLPFETRDLVDETIALNRQLAGFDSVAPNIFTPYRGTVLRNVALNEGWLDPEQQTNSFVGGSMLTMPAPYLQADQIAALQQTYNFHVSLPCSDRPDIMRVERGEDADGRIKARLSEKFYRVKFGTTEEKRRVTYQG